MKRLIKKSEFYDACKRLDSYIEIYKNPTSKEYETISGGYGARLFVHSDGTIYAWDVEIMHSDMEERLPNIASGLHITQSNGQMAIYLTSEIENMSMLQQYFNAARSGLMNCKIEGKTGILCVDTNYYNAPKDDYYNQIDSLYDIFDYNTNSNVASKEIKRLIKKSYSESDYSKNFVVPVSPLYGQDYFKQRDPNFLAKNKEKHEKGEYKTFDEILQDEQDNLLR